MPKITTAEQASKALIKHMEFCKKANDAWVDANEAGGGRRAEHAKNWESKADEKMLEVLKFLGTPRTDLIRLGLIR